MKKWGQTGAMIGTALLAAVAVVCVAVRFPALSAGDAALAAAGFILPGGAAEALQYDPDTEHVVPASEPASSAPAASAPASSTPAAASVPLPSPPVFALTPNAGTSSLAEPESAAPTDDGTVPTVLKNGVKEMSISNTGVNYGNIWVKNTNTNHTIDIQAELNKQPAVTIKKDGTVQVLIYHTHTTEAYLGDTRTTDSSRSVIAVGDAIAAALEANGIGVVHDTTLHDYPSYNGSYDRSGETIQKNLDLYPTIQVTLDIHRDAMGTSDARVKPTAVVDGKKAAQVMIISGCDDDGSLGFPNWEYNLRLAVRLQQAMADRYPGLARPLNFCPRKYNEHMTKGSLLVEFGTEVNTLEEATYSGQLFGEALVAALNELAG